VRAVQVWRLVPSRKSTGTMPRKEPGMISRKNNGMISRKNNGTMCFANASLAEPRLVAA